MDDVGAVVGVPTALAPAVEVPVFLTDGVARGWETPPTRIELGRVQLGGWQVHPIVSDLFAADGVYLVQANYSFVSEPDAPGHPEWAEVGFEFLDADVSVVDALPRAVSGVEPDRSFSLSPHLAFVPADPGVDSAWPVGSPCHGISLPAITSAVSVLGVGSSRLWWRHTGVGASGVPAGSQRTWFTVVTPPELCYLTVLASGTYRLDPQSTMGLQVSQVPSTFTIVLPTRRRRTASHYGQDGDATAAVATDRAVVADRPVSRGTRRPPGGCDQPTVVVLTALGLECQAVRAHLSDVELNDDRTIAVFEVGNLPGTPWRVALAETGVGNRAAALVTGEAIATFAPDAVVMVGVAGALHRHLNLGDVVVATKVYDYQGGSVTGDVFSARPQAWAAPFDLEQRARLVARSDGWAGSLRPGYRIPPVHFGPIAAGEVVLNSADSALSRQLKLHYNDAVAIEMESAGAAFVGQVNRARILTIRGISDKADGNKYAADHAGGQPTAARHAAAFATSLIAILNPDDMRT